MSQDTGCRGLARTEPAGANVQEVVFALKSLHARVDVTAQPDRLSSASMLIDLELDFLQGNEA